VRLVRMFCEDGGAEGGEWKSTSHCVWGDMVGISRFMAALADAFGLRVWGAAVGEWSGLWEMKRNDERSGTEEGRWKLIRAERSQLEFSSKTFYLASRPSQDSPSHRSGTTAGHKLWDRACRTHLLRQKPS
jgi:hypothetical protein